MRSIQGVAPRRARDQSGATAVEFALVVPLLVSCLLAIVEGGSRYTNQDQASHYAAVVARDIAIDPTQSITGKVDQLKAADGNTRSYTVTATQTCSATQSTAKVTVSATIPSPSGMFGSFTVNGVGVARCEN